MIQTLREEEGERVYVVSLSSQLLTYQLTFFGVAERERATYVVVDMIMTSSGGSHILAFKDGFEHARVVRGRAHTFLFVANNMTAVVALLVLLGDLVAAIVIAIVIIAIPGWRILGVRQVILWDWDMEECKRIGDLV